MGANYEKRLLKIAVFLNKIPILTKGLFNLTKGLF